MTVIIRIPEGGNELFELLEQLVGEPVKTERSILGLGASRIDTFSCGCVRTYTAMMVLGPEVTEGLVPCAEHRGLVPKVKKGAS